MRESCTVALELYPAFAATTICRPRPWSMGCDVISDSKYEPECGFMLRQEVEILRQCSERTSGQWVDIGARTGWTTAHIATQNFVVAIDPSYADRVFRNRAQCNIENTGLESVSWWAGTSNEFFEYIERKRGPGESQIALPDAAKGPFAGVCIDGNHDSPFPLNDAKNALAHLADTGVIVFHDFWGRPIREGVEYLMGAGLRCRVYDTPCGLAVCWRGDFVPPEHVRDPVILWQHIRVERASEFDFGACA